MINPYKVDPGGVFTQIEFFMYQDVWRIYLL